MRRMIRGLRDYYGPWTMFVTLNPSELNAHMFMKIAGKTYTFDALTGAPVGRPSSTEFVVVERFTSATTLLEPPQWPQPGPWERDKGPFGGAPAGGNRHANKVGSRPGLLRCIQCRAKCKGLQKWTAIKLWMNTARVWEWESSGLEGPHTRDGQQASRQIWQGSRWSWVAPSAEGSAEDVPTLGVQAAPTAKTDNN